jgi:hypothetical protein
MNTTQEPKFCAVTRNANGEPMGYWLGTRAACERFAERELSDWEDAEAATIEEVDPSTTWEQMRDLLWPSDPNAKGRVIWSGTWSELKVK